MQAELRDAMFQLVIFLAKRRVKNSTFSPKDQLLLTKPRLLVHQYFDISVNYSSVKSAELFGKTLLKKLNSP